MNNNPTVFIVCGVFNHLEDTKRFLKCIRKQSYLNIKTFIVDDGSTDGTTKYIRNNYPEINILKGNGNLWWTGAMYIGVEEVLKIAKNNDFILTINNDCIFDKDYIQTLLDSGIKLNKTIVGSLVVDSNDCQTIYDAGVKIDWKKGKFISLPPKKIKEINSSKLYQDDIDTLSTNGTLYPIEVFKKVGNFDKKHFPHYLSDYEFACRAKKNGFKLILNYQAIVYNDTVRTGLWKNEKEKVSLKETWDLLFSRRSKVNMIDNFKFIKYCCPKEYKFKNYIFLLRKIIISGYNSLFL